MNHSSFFFNRKIFIKRISKLQIAKNRVIFVVIYANIKAKKAML